MTAENDLNDAQEGTRDMATKSSRNAFLIHLAAFIVVNGILVALNATKALEPGEVRDWWSLYVIAGWGIGVVAHGFAVWAGGRARAGSLLADPVVRGVAVHLFVYLAVNAFLIFINLKKSPDAIWAIWPILGWGIGLAAHAWLAYRKVLRTTMERYATEQQILTQMQLEQQAARIAEQIAAEQEPEKKKAPARRRRKTAAKTTKKTTRKAPAKKPAAKKKTPAKRKPAAKRKTSTKSARAKSS